MKTVLLCSVLFCVITLPAIGELTAQDLNKIRILIDDALEPIKADIVTLKTDVAEMKGKFDGIDNHIDGIDKQFVGIQNQITHVTYITYGLLALIVAAIAIPQIIITWRSVSDTEQQKINQELRQEIEKLKQQRIVNP